jgi:hypothetical protein
LLSVRAKLRSTPLPIGINTAGSRSARNPDSTPKCLYKPFSGSAIVSNGSDPQYPPQLLGAGVEHNNFPNGCGYKLLISPRERAQVKIAKRTSGKPSELKMDYSSRLRNPDNRGADRTQGPLLNPRAILKTFAHEKFSPDSGLADGHLYS